ncbi:MAG TPA: DUF1249 domain-containing protein [Gammaproteobacteria bacterium]|nr:DUF1249 domain-containing protein [Xanthomonadales bacterium]HPI97022.1 DUF1249 domain-containing protein [Gammaproteobacteria bacterium]
MITNPVKNKIRKSEIVNPKCLTLRHENNFVMLQLLLPNHFKTGEKYISTAKNRPRLVMKIINCYKYTTEIIMNYEFDSQSSEEINIKIYHDAQLAEIVYCTDVQKFIRLLGPKVCPQIHKKTRTTLNTFLQKWLNFLLAKGYSGHLWQLIS